MWGSVYICGLNPQMRIDVGEYHRYIHGKKTNHLSYFLFNLKSRNPEATTHLQPACSQASPCILPRTHNTLKNQETGTKMGNHPKPNPKARFIS